MTPDYYMLDAEDFEKLRRLAERLHSGTDRERDEGHRLWLILERAEPASFDTEG